MDSSCDAAASPEGGGGGGGAGAIFHTQNRGILVHYQPLWQACEQKKHTRTHAQTNKQKQHKNKEKQNKKEPRGVLEPHNPPPPPAYTPGPVHHLLL